MDQGPAQRQQSAAEEVANCISHGIAFVLAAASLPILVHLSLVGRGDLPHTIAVGVYVATMLLLYLSSALFHGLPSGRGKRIFETLDRAAIYLFIAGSYTPFAASALHGGRAWLTLALVWALALLGVWVTLSKLITHPFWSTGLYVGMGWLALFAAMPWIERASALGVRLLVAGGLAYTLGAMLFLLSVQVRFAHLVWHLFVMAGSGLHFAATLSLS